MKTIKGCKYKPLEKNILFNSLWNCFLFLFFRINAKCNSIRCFPFFFYNGINSCELSLCIQEICKSNFKVSHKNRFILKKKKKTISYSKNGTKNILAFFPFFTARLLLFVNLREEHNQIKKKRKHKNTVFFL